MRSVYTLFLSMLLLLIPSLYDFILIFICCFVFPELLSFTFSFSVVAHYFVILLFFSRTTFDFALSIYRLTAMVIATASVAKHHCTRFQIIKAIFSICEHDVSMFVLYCIVLCRVVCILLYVKYNSIYLHVWIFSLPGDISITERCRSVPMLHHH